MLCVGKSEACQLGSRPIRFKLRSHFCQVSTVKCHIRQIKRKMRISKSGLHAASHDKKWLPKSQLFKFELSSRLCPWGMLAMNKSQKARISQNSVKSRPTQSQDRDIFEHKCGLMYFNKVYHMYHVSMNIIHFNFNIRHCTWLSLAWTPSHFCFNMVASLTHIKSHINRKRGFA